MSSYIYGAGMRNREIAKQNESTQKEPPGLSTSVDSLAALVPAEVLGLHAFFITLVSPTSPKLGDRVFLIGVLVGGCVLSIAIYVWGHKGQIWIWSGKALDGPDKFPRMFVPAVAFVAWTMAQRETAWDALVPSMSAPVRFGLAAFLALVLGLVAAKSSSNEDGRNGPGQSQTSP
jgi:hypothetical protein